MDGFYHSIERCGTVDGPGIRYVLFLSGCSLRCSFCHNPDTWQRGDQTIDVETVLLQYERHRHFYDASGGGITLSGGEPMLQSEFAAELLAACRKRNIHTMIDTAGHYPSANLAAVLPQLDAAMFSIKTALPAKHKEICGAEPDLAWNNLRRIAASVLTTLRYVLIPGLTDKPEDLAALASLYHTLPAQTRLELLPYHSLGRYKWQTAGLAYSLNDVPDASLQNLDAASDQLRLQGVRLVSHN